MVRPMVTTMAYAGAAGALTTFIGMPLAGALFVLEITRASAGLAAQTYDALSPAVAASCAVHHRACSRWA